MEFPMKKVSLISGSLAAAMVLAVSVGPKSTLVAQTPAPQQAAPPAGGAARGGERPTPPPPPPAVMPAPVAPIVSATAPNPDPRVGLKAGRWDAGQAAWNVRMISTTP